MKIDHDLIGPHDAVRIAVDCAGKYNKVLVYDRVLEGDVESPNVCAILR